MCNILLCGPLVFSLGSICIHHIYLSDTQKLKEEQDYGEH
jgi:hypothetical protein